MYLIAILKLAVFVLVRLSPNPLKLFFLSISIIVYGRDTLGQSPRIFLIFYKVFANIQAQVMAHITTAKIPLPIINATVSFSIILFSLS